MPRPFTRRQFLRTAGVALALPRLESFAHAATVTPPRRMIAVCSCLGLVPEAFFPKEAGAGYSLSPYLEILKEHRDDFSVISGLSHPDVSGGHSTEVSFLTAAPGPGGANFRNSISLDQFVVERLKPNTRFPFLALSSYSSSLSFSPSGVQIPSETKPSAVFAKLFLNGTMKKIEQQVNRLCDDQSVLDTVLGEANRLRRKVSVPDRERLDQYFSAVREVEQRLAAAKEWTNRPKPKVSVPPPRDIANTSDTIGRTRLMFDLAHLAFETDSTRIITLKVDVMPAVPPIAGVNLDHHNLSHHGKDPDKLAQLRLIETAQLAALRDFLAKLHASKEQGENLLNSTAVLYGSNLGNASSHDTKNLPILLAGGGFRHGKHLTFDTRNNTPLCNLYVSLLQRMGVEADRFATGRSRLNGLELV